MMKTIVLFVLYVLNDVHAYVRKPFSNVLPINHELLQRKHVDGNIPEQVFVSPFNVTYDGEELFYSITYSTSVKTTSIVHWGEENKTIYKSATGNWDFYSGLNWDNEGKNKQGLYFNMEDIYTSLFIHTVQIGPLKPNTKYKFKAGMSLEEETWSFVTVPKIGRDETLTFALVGDLGQTEDSATTIQHITQIVHEHEIPLLLFVGDISYADGYHPRWETYGRLAEKMHSSVATLLTGGNHEISSGESWVAYFKRFPMPFQMTSKTQLWYSYNTGPAHFIILCSYAPFIPGSPQHDWLLQNFANIDRTQTPWVIVNMHAPWYSSNDNHNNETEAMRLILEPIFHENKVDIFFTGHVHAYERTTPVYNGNKVDCGPVHITIGDGGNREGVADTWQQPSPEWSVFHESSFGFGLFEIESSTEAKWTWHRNEDAEATIADSVIIHRCE